MAKLLSSAPNAAADQMAARNAAYAAAQLQAKRAASAQGYQSTKTSGAQGAGPSVAAPVATKTLLGQ